MKDFLDDIFSTIQFKSVVYFKYGFCSPWGMDVPKGNFSQFHLVTSGYCILQLEQQQIELHKGDVVIFPHGHSHQIKDAFNTKCQQGKEVVSAIVNGKAPFSGRHPKTHLICGHYEMDKEVSHPIFDALPNLLIVKSNEYGRYELINSIFELLAEELQDKKLGYKTTTLSLAKVLFISVIRHYYGQQKEEEVNLFKDEAICQTINFIHHGIAKELTIKKLAREVGLSRTLFIDRFKKAVGNTPLQYITSWRMIKAKSLLKNTDLPLVEIGEKVGYTSETAFHRVFKKRFQVSPGQYRKTNLLSKTVSSN